jgi:hypothetical protein
MGSEVSFSVGRLLDDYQAFILYTFLSYEDATLLFFYNAMTFVPVDGIDEALKVALVLAETETEMPEAMIANGELPQPKASLS